MTTNNPGSSQGSLKHATYSNFQRQEKNKSFSRLNMPGSSSSRETQRRNPIVPENAVQSQGRPKPSNDQIARRGSAVHPSEAQIRKMTFEQVVSSILQFLGKDPNYMASVDPNRPGQSKSRKRKQNPKLSETTDQASKK